MPFTRLGIIGAGGIAELALATLPHVCERRWRRYRCWSQSLLPGKRNAFWTSLETSSRTSRRENNHAQSPRGCAGCRRGMRVAKRRCELRAGHSRRWLRFDRDLDRLARGRSLAGGARSSRAKVSGRILLPSGAIGGIDALSAARLSGVEQVTYTGRKPAERVAQDASRKNCSISTHSMRSQDFLRGNRAGRRNGIPISTPMSPRPSPSPASDSTRLTFICRRRPGHQNQYRTNFAVRSRLRRFHGQIGRPPPPPATRRHRSWRAIASRANYSIAPGIS